MSTPPFGKTGGGSGQSCCVGEMQIDTTPLTTLAACKCLSLKKPVAQPEAKGE